MPMNAEGVRECDPVVELLQLSRDTAQPGRPRASGWSKVLAFIQCAPIARHRYTDQGGPGL
ncbi:hypothetical protein GCM10007320_10620 [Pseudorhodoferax aquiterrae]|uniref:Uncharacterized protein n=1 Tax=Pseudorhodoferax aquiterrae TaxID=747304 RepID=A0ABQ3FX02_9BURK|nr:hypothetical protein GCM10007320_10620 [Pseudorhodoferax aquiterrae]